MRGLDSNRGIYVKILLVIKRYMVEFPSIEWLAIFMLEQRSCLLFRIVLRLFLCRICLYCASNRLILVIVKQISNRTSLAFHFDTPIFRSQAEKFNIHYY
nr:hypothetical protein Iba_chr07fCG11270 [Ipomoea batatas]